MDDLVLVGIDVGGTFTDFVVLQAGRVRIHKVSTTPEDQSRAIITGLRELGLLDVAGQGARPTLAIVHGMTVATNALLERRGATTALVTTAGFRDVLVIGRQNRPHLYHLTQQRPAAMVADALRLEVTERLDHTGAVIDALHEEAFDALAADLVRNDAESLAVCFLFSFRNPTHERRAAELIRARLPELPISLSSDILPEYREYERTATTVINAYVQPLVARYLRRLEQSVADFLLVGSDDGPDGFSRRSSLHIMQSNGGTIGLHQAAQQAARLVLSGPAGGVVGAFAVASQARQPQNLTTLKPHEAVRSSGLEEIDGSSPPQNLTTSKPHEVVRSSGLEEIAGSPPPQNLTTSKPQVALMSSSREVNLITFDMGGTSTDVALCPGEIPTTAESTIADLPLRLPAIDIHTVGAGGGSIAFVDAGGGLRVGPRSAGADPGPACYGRGGLEPTVTDANLVLGRLDAGGFLGGSGDVSLDAAAARQVLSVLGERLGLTAEQAALGVLRVANATMERALRRISVERGHDPRQFTLLPFGGAGPLHACDLADALGMRRVLVPPFPGVLSAYGMLMAGVSTDASQSLLRRVDALLHDSAEMRAAITVLDERVRAVLIADGVLHPTISVALDMRYQGQSYELTVPLVLPIDERAIRSAEAHFHALHARRYGYGMEGEAVEVVTLRVAGAGPGAPLAVTPRPLAGADASPARLGDRPVWFDQRAPLTTTCYDRARLAPGNRIVGPALVLQYDATTLIVPGWESVVDEHDNLWLFRIS
jgi:N-methylhydantoinase A